MAKRVSPAPGDDEQLAVSCSSTESLRLGRSQRYRMIRGLAFGAWVETAGKSQIPRPVTTAVRRTSATSCLCTRSVSPCSTIPSPTAQQATLGRPRREAESAYGTGSALRLLLGGDTNSRVRYGKELGSPSSVVQTTVRRFAASGIKVAKAVSTV